MFYFDQDRFFADFPGRTKLSITTQRTGALTFLLTQLSQDPAFTMIRELAYILATIQWETKNTFIPCKEGRASITKQPKIRELQNRYWDSGFYGRGYVQITWKENYLRAGRRLAGQTFELNGIQLAVTDSTFVDFPDQVLEPTIAYAIATDGMRAGWFTKKKLSDYIRQGHPPDYRNARRIINGMDNADNIANMAAAFELLLRASLKDKP